MENKLIPYQPTQYIEATSALVFAPHPDDEIFGCGGAILRHVEMGIAVHVVIVSDGAFGAEVDKRSKITAAREMESSKAASILGYGQPEFWRLPDRGITYGEALIQRLMDKIQLTASNLVYAPSLIEMHPDHRALAMSVIEAVRRSPNKPRLALYEVGVPLHPNLLLNISDLSDRKKLAMECFESQNKQQRYDLDISALNRYRTYSLPKEVTAAEAYILCSAEDLINDPFKLYQSEYQRQKTLGLALKNTDIPLVSVIIRSMDRPTLSDALDSVALQTYSNIEVLVVAASGKDHHTIGQVCGRYPLKLEISTDGMPLTRSQAANLGLRKANGQWIIFLDDDDLFDPDHIANLVDALSINQNFNAAYTGIRVVDGTNNVVSIFNTNYDQNKLFSSNFIPIHALMFSRSLLDESGAQFDEDMEIYEDWDFWIQLSNYTTFLHINKISASYRAALGNSGLSLNIDESLQREGRELIFDKWRLLWTGKQINQTVQYLIDKNNILSSEYEHNINELEQGKSKLEQHISELELGKSGLEKYISKLEHIKKNQDIKIAKLISSNSWKLTKPFRWLSRVVRGDLIGAMDPINKIFNSKKPPKNRNFQTTSTIQPTHLVAVILPVYRDIKMTERCIVKAMSGILTVTGARILAINDASPDVGMQEMLEQLATQWPDVFEVLENKKNLGFVGTVNRGLSYYSDYDVVLLNSDVIVPHNWLSRLIDEAYSNTNIGTVTPFSNNATICSFPHFLQENNQPFNLDVDEIDIVFRQGKLPCIEAPTGVGFCMYIRRSCLDEIGYLNEEKFGRGYGEENDLCQRASKKGWLNIISPNIYAYHEGSVSFSSDKHALIDNAIKVIDKLHPNYHTDIQYFIQHDPLKSARVARFIQLISVLAIPKILHVTHSFGGGTAQHIDELTDHFRQDIAHIILSPDGDNGQVSIRIGTNKAADKLIYSMPTEYLKLVDVLKAIGINTVHFHHSYGLDWKILDLPNDLGVSHLLTVHDYYWLNGNPTLTDETGNYPGFYSELLYSPLYPLPAGKTVADWQRRFRPLFEDAACIIFPSHSTKIFFKNIYCLDNAVVSPHIESTLTVGRPPSVFTKQTTYTIGVLGALGKEKGADLLEQIAKETKKLGLPFKFKLIGYAYKALKGVDTTGPYITKDLANLIKKNGLNIILFPARWPETYSYTLSHALDSGLPIIAPNIGAFPERLSGRKNTLLFTHLTSPANLADQINVFIEKLANGHTVKAPFFKGEKYKHDFYISDYLPIVTRNLKTIDVNKTTLFEFDSKNIISGSANDNKAWREALLQVLWRLYTGRSTRWFGHVIPKKARVVIRKSLSDSNLHDIVKPSRLDKL